MESSNHHGMINGRPGLFRIENERISCLEKEDEDPHAEWIDIPLKNIIALIPTVAPESPGYSILHVVDNPTPDGSGKQMPIHPRSLQVGGLPATFIKQFQLANETPWAASRQQSQGGIPMKLHVVISTGSGTGLARAWWEQLVRPSLAENGISAKSYTLHTTVSDSSVTELMEGTILPQANQGVAQAILLLSGDGGVVDTVNALLHAEQSDSYKKPLLTLLPAGTGNALANSAVVGDDNTMGMRTMLCGTSKEVPTFRAAFSPGARLLVSEGNEERVLDGSIDGRPLVYGAVVCSWGFHAALVADSDTTEYRKFGAERFKMAGKEALFPSDGSPPHTYKGKVSIIRPGRSDWEAIPRDEHGYILATLVSNLEAGFTISPSSRPLDGKLWLVHFGHLSGQEAMESMTKAYQGGKHVEDEKIGYDEIEGLRIEFNEDDGRWRRVCIDGKIVRVEKDGWVEVRKEARGVVDLLCKKT